MSSNPIAGSTVVLVDDESFALWSMEAALNVLGVETVKTFTDGETALTFMRDNDFDCAVLDIMMPGISGRDILKYIKEKDPDLPVIMATGVNDITIAVECMKNGACDYILKPVEHQRIIVSVQNALRIRKLQNENAGLAAQLLSDGLENPEHFSEFVTINGHMLRLFKYIEAVAPTEHPVLITGETGVGKELVAKAIHRASGRSGPFFGVNIAGLDDNVFSDTLFGHVKGAFTGAENVRKGLVETAGSGTLFLDEIGDLNQQSQVKLLRLLQEHEFYPIGSDTARHCGARIVAATCKPISMLAGGDAFRKDLYFRLRTHHVNIPPLRERKDDIPVLIQYFVGSAAAQQKKAAPVISQDLLKLLETHSFPGNVRELQSMVFDAMSLQAGGKLQLSTFRNRIGDQVFSDRTVTSEISVTASSNQLAFPEKLPGLKQFTKLLIAEAMKRAKGNQTTAAAMLGITRQALGHRLKTSD